VVDEERMRPGHWLGLVLCVPFSALTLIAGWQEGHPARKNPHSTNPRGSLLEQVEKDQKEDWLTQVHVEDGR